MCETDRRATEALNESSRGIDLLPIPELLRLINAEDHKVPQAVASAIPAIAALVEALVPALKGGGRLLYIGAGTSGRLAVLDASECPPTYGVSPNLVQGVIAGGERALRHAVENAEDDEAQGEKDIAAFKVGPRDCVLGVAASGRTPYVAAALRYAKSQGALTAALSCVADAPLSALVDFPIEVQTGAEIVAGSTRMKAGTAQKLVLNMVSTASMIALGKVYDGYMIDVQPSNHKLRERARDIVAHTTGCSPEAAAQILGDTNYEVKRAILCQLTGITVEEAGELLERYDNQIAKIIRDRQKRS